MIHRRIGIIATTLALASACFFSSSHADEVREPGMIFSAGANGGGYWGVAERLREVAAESGLGVRVRESAGSMQNLQRLSDPSSEFNLALAQDDAIEHFQWMRIYPTDR